MGLEEARRLLSIAKEKQKLAANQRSTRSKSVGGQDKEKEMESLVAQKILLIGSAPEITPYINNSSVSTDTNLILQKLHEEKMDRLQAEYKQKKQMVDYFEAIMADKIEKAKAECLTTVAELEDDLVGETGKIELAIASGTTQLKKDVKSIWSAISDLRIAKTKDGVSSDEVLDDITKKVTEKVKDDLKDYKAAAQPSRGKMAPRQRAEILKDNYLRNKSSREIVIRGIKNDTTKEAIEIARSAFENHVTQAQFYRDQIVSAQWKGRDVEIEKRETLVVLFDNEANRQNVFESLTAECKKRTAKVFFRQGMCPADLQRFRELHTKFEEFEKAGKINQGAKCTIKGSNGHYYLPKKLFKNAEDSEETEEPEDKTAANGENKNKAKKTRKTGKPAGKQSS